MANGLQLNTSTVVAGLATQTYTIVTAGFYTCTVNFDIPYIAAGTSSDSSASAPSALSIVVNQDTGGGPVAKLTVSSPSANQPFMYGRVGLSCSAGDVITVVTSSSNAADKGLNAIKGIVNLYQGIA